MQLATVMLWLAFTGAQPEAVIESSSDGLRRSNESIRYRDIIVRMIRGENAFQTLLVIEVILQFDKNTRRRNKL